MTSRYQRNFPALTEAEQQTLAGCHVLVAGCGGLGGNIIEHLLRVGVGHITAVDGDTFEPTNLNRQLLSQVSLLGTSKAAAAAARAEAVNPQVDFRAIHTRITTENAAQLICGCDAVMDALDNIESRKALFAACSDAGIPFIHGAIGGWNVQCALCTPGSTVLDTLYPPQATVRNKSVLSFTPALCAAMQVSLCTRLLCGRPVEANKLYLYDLLSMEGTAFSL